MQKINWLESCFSGQIKAKKALKISRKKIEAVNNFSKIDGKVEKKITVFSEEVVMTDNEKYHEMKKILTLTQTRPKLCNYGRNVNISNTSNSKACLLS